MTRVPSGNMYSCFWSELRPIWRERAPGRMLGRTVGCSEELVTLTDEEGELEEGEAEEEKGCKLYGARNGSWGTNIGADPWRRTGRPQLPNMRGCEEVGAVEEEGEEEEMRGERMPFWAGGVEEVIGMVEKAGKVASGGSVGGVAAAVRSCSKCLSSSRFCSSWPWLLMTEPQSSLPVLSLLICVSTFLLHLRASDMNFCFWSSKERPLYATGCLPPTLLFPLVPPSLVSPPLVLGSVLSHWYRSMNSISCSFNFASSFISIAGLGTGIGVWVSLPCNISWVVRGITGSLCW